MDKDIQEILEEIQSDISYMELTNLSNEEYKKYLALIFGNCTKFICQYKKFLDTEKEIA